MELGVPVGFSVAPGEGNDTSITIEQPGTYLFEVLVISPTFLGVTVVLAEPAAGFSSNAALTISQPGVYLFDMDASDPAAPVPTITLAAPPGASPAR
jgi:hypothetical protein